MSNANYDTTLTDEYIAAVKRPAEVFYDFRRDDNDNDNDNDDDQGASLARIILGGSSNNNKENNGPTPSSQDEEEEEEEEPVAFVIRNVLTPSECEELIEEAEFYGIRDGDKYVARSAKRTKNYTNADLSQKVDDRIRGVLESLLLVDGAETQRKDFMGPVHGIHNNWRILRYDTESGDAFPAHQDQMDSFQQPKPDGSGRKDLVVSSHTLLLQLSPNSLEGGCTRFYPNGRMRLPKNTPNDIAFRNSQFENAVDVALPTGWALVFKQRGLMHAGQPLSPTSPCPKHVAQAGILRILPDGVLQKPSVFRNGLGVTKLVTYGEAATKTKTTMTTKTHVVNNSNNTTAGTVRG